MRLQVERQAWLRKAFDALIDHDPYAFLVTHHTNSRLKQASDSKYNTARSPLTAGFQNIPPPTPLYMRLGSNSDNTIIEAEDERDEMEPAQ